MTDAPYQDTHPPRDLVGLSEWLLGERSWNAPARGEISERTRRLLRLTVCCLVLAALPFLTRPGQIIADTKIDLAVNPARFLSRALQVWDPTQFGQLQDQAYGYFFPVGPFFVLGKLMDLPAWVVQRLWIAAILIAAFIGVIRLCRRLGIGTPGSQIVAGFAYALSAPMLSELGVLSSEVLPAAMMPWILLPIVRSVQDWPTMSRAAKIRAAAQSATAVALCSGVNAAATFAVLVPAGIYLLAAPRPCPRWRIMSYWVPAVILASSWWIYPLLMLDKYGVSILPYTESAAVTTSVTSLSNSLRGTEDWISYLVVNGQPWWPVAYRVANGTLPILLTGLIAGLGITGLLGRRMPERRFMLIVLLLGVFVILSGYVSGLGNPVAAHLDHAINGPLSPFRNVRKFDPLIRLPIALGLASLVGSAKFPRPQKALALLSSGAIAALALPAYTSGITTPGAFPSVPSYWTQAANWLNQRAGSQAVLELPGARFGQYTWGSPMDDIMEPLSTVDWASSQLSAIGSVGNTRVLEAIDQQMAAGEGSPGLTQLMARMGIKYVLVRNDLLRSDLRGAWPARIHQALAESPGIAKVASFGKLPVGTNSPDDAVSDFDSYYLPVEIYKVSGAEPVASVQPTSSTLRVYGAPESLITLGDQGLLGNRPVLLDSGSPQIHASSTVVTDSLRRRTRNFGEIRDDYSQTLTAHDPATTFEAADDYTEPSWQPYMATAAYHGIANVTASSSDADYDAVPQQSATGRLPYAALDQNLGTFWESGSLNGPVGQWIKVSYNSPRDPGTIKVAFVDNRAIGPQVTQVEVSTAAGHVTDNVKVTGQYQTLRVPPGASRWLQITVTGVFDPPNPDVGRQVAIAEISIPGITATRTIVAPDVSVPGGGDPTDVVLSKAEPQPSGCMQTSARWVCNPSLIKPTEEQFGFNHTFTLQQPVTASLTGTAVLTNPNLIERYAFPGNNQPQVTGSSYYTADPEDLPSSAFDGNTSTSWVASPADSHPTLTIRWQKSVTVSSLTITRPPAASGPLQVQITGSGKQTFTTLVPASGKVRIAPMRTDSLTFTFTPSQAPLQITNVAIPGVKQLGANPNWTFQLGCGLGPQIKVDGVSVPTKVSGTFGDVLEGRPLSYSACSAVSLAGGSNEVIEPQTDAFSVQAAVLNTSGVISGAGAGGTGVTGTGVTGTAAGSTGPGSTAAKTTAPAPAQTAAAASVPSEHVDTVKWTDSSRVVRVTAASQSYLEVNQNFNTGWQATAGGRTLQPVELDGWRQAWILPAGTDGLVTMTYLPQASYSTALLGGLAAAALVMLIALVPLGRRWRAGPLRGPGAAPATGQAPYDPAGTDGYGTYQPRPSPRFYAQPPDPPAPGKPRNSRFTFGVLLLAGVAVTPVVGLWIGGLPGALLLPITMVIFVPALARRGHGLISRVVADPAVAVVLLVTASLVDAIGSGLNASGGAGGGVITSTTNTVPELLCLVIVGRVAAALALPDQALDQAALDQAVPEQAVPDRTAADPAFRERPGPDWEQQPVPDRAPADRARRSRFQPGRVPPENWPPPSVRDPGQPLPGPRPSDRKPARLMSAEPGPAHRPGPAGPGLPGPGLPGPGLPGPGPAGRPVPPDPSVTGPRPARRPVPSGPGVTGPHPARRARPAAGPGLPGPGLPDPGLAPRPGLPGPGLEPRPGLGGPGPDEPSRPGRHGRTPARPLPPLANPDLADTDTLPAIGRGWPRAADGADDTMPTASSEGRHGRRHAGYVPADDALPSGPSAPSIASGGRHGRRHAQEPGTDPGWVTDPGPEDPSPRGRRRANPEDPRR
jgi:arabinofuranan 3-O-arabinosyltransferase